MSRLPKSPGEPEPDFRRQVDAADDAIKAVREVERWRKRGDRALIALAAVVAVTLVLVLASLVGVRATQIRNCEGSNDVRAGIRDQIDKEGEDARAFDPSIFNLTREEFDALLDEQDISNEETKTQFFADAHCGGLLP